MIGRLLCRIFGHRPETYGSQASIGAPYHDGIGRAHRTVTAKCVRCEQYFRVCGVIDKTHQQWRSTHG